MMDHAWSIKIGSLSLGAWVIWEILCSTARVQRSVCPRHWLINREADQARTCVAIAWKRIAYGLSLAEDHARGVQVVIADADVAPSSTTEFFPSLACTGLRVRRWR